MLPSDRLTRWLVAAACLLLATGILSGDAVVDALTGEPVPEVGLRFSASYLLLAPILGVLDHVSLLTDHQHIVVLVSLALSFVAWRAAGRLFANGRSGGLVRECVLVLGALASLIAFYGFGILGTRPMAALRSNDPDLVIVDFHSHTDASHDGRLGFDLRARREWHESAGFDLFYVTDHATAVAAAAAVRDNPKRAGEGTSLLPGRETLFRDQHVIVLGTEDPAAISPHAAWPTLIQTIPNDLSGVPEPSADGREGVHAIELIDADPRGLRQSAEDRELLRALADSLDLALLAGSNHHGWGRVAAAWNLIRVPGWRERSPDAVGSGIEAKIRTDHARAARVVERTRLAAGLAGEEAILDALALPRLAWHILTHLTLPERAAWFGWLGMAGLLSAPLTRRWARGGKLRPARTPID